MKKILLTFAALVAVVAVSAQNVATVIIPRPMETTAAKGVYVVTPKTVIVPAEDALVRPAEIFAGYVAAEEQMTLAVEKGAKKGIVLALDSALGKEEYTLDVTSKGVSIKGGTPQGVFYGLQSLRQMLAAGVVTKKGVQIEAVSIKDKPLLGYRGAMLDVCRHFFTVKEVKQFIDMIAMHKMNVFHWHLTEDQGWRIEIKKYPNLVKKGSLRKQTVIGRWNSQSYDGMPYGGYYTQEEIREVVKYAAERYIEIIPEIDMPGHMVAALASYNWLGCRDQKFEVRPTWGISEDVLCVGKESTFTFIEDVLAEIFDLFPSKYIHLGGDEAPQVRWKECPHCQKRIQTEGLKDETELQSYFTRRVEAILAKHDRKLVGWDEVIHGGVNKSVTLMLWQDKNRQAVTSLGNDVILSPKLYCYTNYYQTKRPYTNKEGDLHTRTAVTLRKAYSLNPYENLTPEQCKNIKGVQCNLWTEFVKTFERVQTKMLPRMSAIAEVGWSQGEKDFDDFARRMQHMRKFYDKAGFHHYATYFFDGVDEK